MLIVGTGSVALFAAQFARMHGARVICISDPFGGRYLAIRRIAVGSRADFEA